MNTEFKKVVEILEESKIKAVAELKSPENLLQKNKLLKGLDKLINSFRTIGGEQIASELEPVTHMFGRPINKASQTDDSFDEEERKGMQRQNEADWFRERVNLAYSAFKTSAPTELLETYSDIEIRGVARMAGMDFVTETDPDNVDVAFVLDIKDAIVLKEKNDEILKESEEASEEVELEGASDSDANTVLSTETDPDNVDVALSSAEEPAEDKPNKQQKSKGTKGK